MTGFLKGLVDSSQIRLVKPDPIIRGATYKQVRIPDSLRQTEPITLVEVRNAQEIALILRRATQERMPIYVRQGTGWVALDIVRPEPPGAIVLDLRRLNWIRPNFDSGYVEVGPAVSEQALNDILSPHGFSYPEFIGPVTWGGLASMNTSGRSVDPHTGKPGDYLMGLEIVLPTGEIIQTGTRSHRRPCGVDLTWLFTGFQALVGVMTNIRIRLVPSPRNIRWGAVYVPTVEAAGEVVCQLYRKGVPPPRTLELMDRHFLELGGVPTESSGAVMLVATDGWTETEAEAKLNAIFGLAKEQGAKKTSRLSSEESRDFMKFRNEQNVGGNGNRFNELGLFPLIGTVMDGPLETFVESMEAADKMIQEIVHLYPGLHGARIGHIGAGMFHPVFFAPNSWDFDRLQLITHDIRGRLVGLQLQFGCTSGEQGIFPQHYDWFHQYYGADYVSVVNRIKEALDPHNILNPARYSSPTYFR